MPHPIRIRINKKELVSTRRQIKHEYRSDWKTVGIVDYSESPKLFRYLGNGLMKTDAQFAKALIENFGPGTYTCIYWRKGMKGFRKFIMVKCTYEGFNQTKAIVYKNRSKRFEKEQDLARLKQELQEFDNPHEQEAILDEIRKKEESLDYDTRAQGPYPYLESLQPRYRVHGYEDYDAEEEETEDIEEDKPDFSVW